MGRLSRKVICGQGCAGVDPLAWSVFRLYIRAAKVDATKKRSVLKKRIKLSGGFILLSGEFIEAKPSQPQICADQRR
jgi:hypothetical protein